MALSAFDDPARAPAAAELRGSLGAAASLWADLVAHVAGTCPPLEEAWNFSGAKFGWSLRLKQAERVLLYLTPQAGRFLVGVVLGERAVAAAAGKGLPPSVLALLDAAPRYAEGRGVRLTVASGEDLVTVRHLLALKTELPSKARGAAAAPGRAGGEAHRRAASRSPSASPRRRPAAPRGGGGTTRGGR